jgi:hypothetical protein
LGKKGEIPSQARYRYSRDTKAKSGAMNLQVYSCETKVCKILQKKTSPPFFFAHTGENEQMYCIFDTHSFTKSRGMSRGFFVSRGYNSQGPPYFAVATDRREANLLPPLLSAAAAKYEDL